MIILLIKNTKTMKTTLTFESENFNRYIFEIEDNELHTTIKTSSNCYEMIDRIEEPIFPNLARIVLSYQQDCTFAQDKDISHELNDIYDTLTNRD